MPELNESILAPSILAGDHAHLGRSANAAESIGIRWIHLDIMDGHFVPNLTFGPATVRDLRKNSSLFFDVHLMLDNPHKYITPFAEAGADLISIHVEPDYPQAETLLKIRQVGCQNGIVLNPGTAPEGLLPHIENVDLVLVMTVQPGFGGQSFRADQLPKIRKIAAWRKEKNLNFRLEVDGGINLETARQCFECGCDTFVAGSAFFNAPDRDLFAREIEGFRAGG